MLVRPSSILFFLISLMSAVSAFGKTGMMEGSVVYGVVPPLFGEHKLRSVTERLDQLENLGVDVLWIAPVMETDDRSHISYATTDHKKIRDDFGSEDDLHELVREAHARKMKVILDFVANHTSIEHRWFTEAKDGKSPTWRFYDRDSNGQATYYFDWKHLPNLNLDDADVVDEIVGSMKFWLTKFDVDGFRYDAAWGPRLRNRTFWKEALDDLRKTKPRMIALAEASAADPAFHRDGFDLAYDWTRKLGQWNWAKAFDDTRFVARHLKKALSVDADRLEKTFHFLNNNDTGERFVTKHGPETTKVATVLAFTIPGVVGLFTGDEIGAEYEPYEDTPPLRWTDDPARMFGFHRELIALRKAKPALASGDFELLDVDQPDQVLSFVRQSGRDSAWVILNFGAARDVVVTFSARDMANRKWRPQFGHGPLAIAKAGPQKIEVRLPARSAFVLDDRP